MGWGNEQKTALSVIENLKKNEYIIVLNKDKKDFLSFLNKKNERNLIEFDNFFLY